MPAVRIAARSFAERTHTLAAIPANVSAELSARSTKRAGARKNPCAIVVEVLSRLKVGEGSPGYRDTDIDPIDFDIFHRPVEPGQFDSCISYLYRLGRPHH